MSEELTDYQYGLLDAQWTANLYIGKAHREGRTEVVEVLSKLSSDLLLMREGHPSTIALEEA